MFKNLRLKNYTFLFLSLFSIFIKNRDGDNKAKSIIVMKNTAAFVISCTFDAYVTFDTSVQL